MSAVFGIIRRADRAPAAAVALLAAKTAMANLGRDAGGTWSDDEAGIGQLQRHDTPEAVHEVMPLVDAELAFTAAARLDGRDELCDALAIPSTERSLTPDGRLVFLAYRRWGRDCALHLAAASPLAIECLDLEAMRAAWNALRASITLVTTERAALILLRGLEFGIFLAEIDGRTFHTASSR